MFISKPTTLLCTKVTSTLGATVACCALSPALYFLGISEFRESLVAALHLLAARTRDLGRRLQEAAAMDRSTPVTSLMSH